MPYYFLPGDYERLLVAITEAYRRVRHHGREMGLSTKEGAETFHDNFAYEDSERRFKMWSRRFRDLVKLRDQAEVISPPTNGERVAIGRSVTLRDLESDEEWTYRIGSYMCFDDDERTISYDAPLAKVLIGAFEGELRAGEIKGREMCFKVVEIQ